MGAEASGKSFEFIDKWNGVRWTTTRLPNFGRSWYQPEDVSCPSVRHCVVIASTSGHRPFSLTFSSGKWTTHRIRVFKSGTLPLTLACVSIRWCEITAYGDYDGSSQGIMEHWNGAQWTMQHDAFIGADDSMDGLMCRSTSWCMAVGSDGTNTEFHSISEQFDGVHWHALSVPWSKSTPPSRRPELSTVDCPTATYCFAMGHHGDFEHPVADAYTWDGSAWTRIPVLVGS
ncbi:MAG TPA: hypothetical protein VGH69_11485 [Mycobacterium sp.]|jgi:hypothetical protein